MARPLFAFRDPYALRGSWSRPTLHREEPAIHEAADHLVFVGDVLAFGLQPAVPPLVSSHAGRYRFLSDAAH
ncbi:MAG: hypothetical protein LC808_10235 [Actinobacteria bacterium]|nr:hypothetical protein [Actinomycetota bacterium]